MIDLETTGLDPSHHAMIQIAAVRFNYQTREIGPVFDECLTVPPTRFWDQDTLEWWGNQPKVLDAILARARPPREVWNQFTDWVLDTAPSLQETQLWAKPTHFEWPLLQSYAREFERDLPFHYRMAIDLNSFCRGLANDPRLGSLDKKINFVGDAHNALDDTMHQVAVALMAKELIDAAAAA